MLWGCTPAGAKPWVSYRKREIVFRESVIGLCRGFGVRFDLDPARKDPKRRQKVGEYCGGRDLEECRRMFGKVLEEVCATCPD